MDNALKAVAESKYELVVENKIIVFGGRDAAGFMPVPQADGTLGYAKTPNADGSLGERFIKETDLESPYTKTGRLLIDFEHGRDPDEIGNTKNEILGYVDWKTATVTDDGVIVKRVLNRRHKYMKWLEPLIRAGLVGNSSEAVPGLVKKAVDGTLVRWGLKRDSLTVMPMESRMLTGNVLTAIKALAQDFPQYKSLIPSDGSALPEAGETNTNFIQTITDVSQPSYTITTTANTNGGYVTYNAPAQKAGKEYKMEMTPELQAQIDAVAAKSVASALATRDAEEKAKVEKAAADKALFDEAYKKGVEDAIKNRKAPNYNKIPKESKENEQNGVAPFKHWMITGQVNDELYGPDSYQEYLVAYGKADPNIKAAWNVTTGASGGFLVPDPLYNRIIEKRNLRSWVRRLPCQYFETVSDHLLVPRENTSHTNYVQTNEGGTYDENEGTVSQKDLILYKYTKMQKVSKEFLSYQQTNWDAWLMNALSRAVAGTENTIYTDGTGTGEPEGVVTGATTSGITTAALDAITQSELSGLVGVLGEGYNVEAECGFLMKNATKWYLKGLTANPFSFVSTPQGGDFYGYPAAVSDDMDAKSLALGKPIIFGNWNFFGVVEKTGMVVDRNPYLYMATGQVGLFSEIFRGGGVLQSEAFYYLNNHS